MKQRIAYIDQIKVFLTCMVVAHHAAQAYGPTGGVWVVSDEANADWLGHFFFINASYMMGLYFFISGYFLVFSTSRKPRQQIIKDRLKRLGIPLLFFTLCVFLPFNYFLSGEKGNIFLFLADTYLNKPPIATGHLWFVASLLVYTFIYLCLPTHKQQQEQVNKPLKRIYIFMYIFILAVISGSVRLYYSVDVWKTWIIPVEVAHIPQYFSMFFLGIMANRNGWLDQLKRSDGVLFFMLALGSYVAYMVLPEAYHNYWLTEALLESLLCVGISIAFLTFFRHYVNSMNKVTAALSANAYGIYLFHVFIVIILQKFVLTWKVNGNVKFITVTIASIFLSYILSAILKKIKWVSTII